MLVLNTNQNWELKSNVRWTGFPDFSQIIIKPVSSIREWRGQIATSPAVKTINGTPINVWTDVVYEEKMKSLPSGQYQWEGFSFVCSENNSDPVTYSCRVWVPKTLSWWEVIGKEVYFECYCVIRWEIKLKVTPKVIHTDWTIDSAGDAPLIQLSKGLNVQNFSLGGLIARSGDILVVDLECQMKNSRYSNSSNRSAYTFLKFGNQAWGNDRDDGWGWPAHVIQVSID